MSNQTIEKAEQGRADVDDLLREFFQAELPRPWPALRVLPPVRARRVGSYWAGSHGRLALAACIALLVAGYMTLSGFFPQQQAPTGVEPQQHIGMTEKGTKRTPGKTPPPVIDDHSGDRPMMVPMNNPR